MERTAGWRSSTETPASGCGRRVVVGRIRGAHGLRGQVRVQYFTNEPDPLYQLPVVALAESEEDPEPIEVEVKAAREGRSGEVRMALDGVRKREAAEALVGRLVLADRQHLGELPEGEYWGFELVGCRVETPDGNAVGTVRDLWSTGAQEVLIVQQEGGPEQRIPAVAAFLREVDVAGRRIVVDPPPGLLAEAAADASDER